MAVRAINHVTMPGGFSNIFQHSWHVKPISTEDYMFKPSQTAQQRLDIRPTRRQESVTAAFSAQRFDHLAEYGSFKILTPGGAAQPARNVGPFGDLRNALRQV